MIQPPKMCRRLSMKQHLVHSPQGLHHAAHCQHKWLSQPQPFEDPMLDIQQHVIGKWTCNRDEALCFVCYFHIKQEISMIRIVVLESCH